MVGTNILSDSKSCPLCGQDNHCGVDDGNCWCRVAVISEELLSRIPEKQRNRSCICQNCIKARSSLSYNALE